MPKSIISEGKTTNEAIENGLKQLKVTKNQVEIKVIENEDKKSFFSILTPRVVKVELTVKENTKKVEHNVEKTKGPKDPKVYTTEEIETAEKNVKIFLDKFINQICKDGKYEINKNKNGLEIFLDGEDISVLIGYRGETLYSMQNILSAVASKGLATRVRIILDIEGYKEKREKTLEDLAQRVANQVIRTRKPVTLEPMKAYERKIIHTALQDSEKVTTYSVGEEPRRRLVISLK